MPQKPSPQQSPVERAVLCAFRHRLEQRTDGLTQNGLARLAGMSPSQLSNVLNGKKPALFSQVVSLAEVLDIDLPVMVEHAERQARKVPSSDVPPAAEATLAETRIALDMEEQAAQDAASRDN